MGLHQRLSEILGCYPSDVSPLPFGLLDRSYGEGDLYHFVASPAEAVSCGREFVRLSDVRRRLGAGVSDGDLVFDFVLVGYDILIGNSIVLKQRLLSQIVHEVSRTGSQVLTRSLPFLPILHHL